MVLFSDMDKFFEEHAQKIIFPYDGFPYQLEVATLSISEASSTGTLTLGKCPELQRRVVTSRPLRLEIMSMTDL